MSTITTPFGATTTAAEDIRSTAAIAEPGGRRGVAAYALDPVAADRLWTVSTELVGR